MIPLYSSENGYQGFKGNKAGEATFHPAGQTKSVQPRWKSVGKSLINQKLELSYTTLYTLEGKVTIFQGYRHSHVYCDTTAKTASKLGARQRKNR